MPLSNHGGSCGSPCHVDHQAEIDAEIEADDKASQDAMAKAASSPLLVRLRTLRAR
jgi:hypothetical protein